MSNNLNWRWILFYLLVAYVHSSSQISTPTSKSYVAAVVEFAPSNVANNSKQTIQSNVARYEKLIQDASAQTADIIVFPEDGITTYHLPQKSEMDSVSTVIPSARFTPCTQHLDGMTEELKRLSCAAMKNQIYVVINIAERVPCYDNECPKGESLYYNSNVVFDRNGTIIAKYRKQNLFVEPQFSTPKHPEIVTFDTDFGVTFGTFICFDILFAVPALNLTRDLGVTDIVYTTAWFSETPFLTAIQTQFGWAFAENVNFLAAGYNNPLEGNTGSGIYYGSNHTSKVRISHDQTTELIIDRVPKKVPKNLKTTKNQETKHSETHVHVHDELRRKRQTTNVNNLKLLRDNVTLYKTEILNGNISLKTLCHDGHCCNFTVNVNKIDTKVKYRLVVFNGIRNYANVRLVGTRVCSIIQCSNDTLESCGSTLDSQTIFQEINISGKFDQSINSLIMPNTLRTDLLPIMDFSYEAHSHDDHKHVSITNSNKAITNLVTFGVYCRDYDRDIKSAAVSNNIAYSFSILMAFLLLRFW
ncbi:PREDICTED: vanin-like protein 2 [Polistes dominula]|uniref:Vanin-like protein 2 n=1 Tax=Polistes dominula TaxID=743375 RepID=A0ABM1IE37_POLDO|nr:PREDICTED: vanin-like protein 2 [Polistes dominula]